MNKIYLYAHGGSENHGCEAIVRSTIKILKEINVEKILISSKPEEDVKYGVDTLCKIIKEKNNYSKYNFNFIKAYFKLVFKKNYIDMDKLSYMKAIKQVNRGDLALSIGGDNYCYADVERYIMLHEMFLKRGAKTILWGCSVEPEILNNPMIANDIKKYSLITARESISYNALKHINENTVLVSDPAFILDKKEVELPEILQKNKFVGINISPMIIDNEKVSGIALKNYEVLIDYIIKNTDFNIALIPHVVWNFSDDRKVLSLLYNKFKNYNRLAMIDDCSCEKLKYIISNCSFFIGARTHSTIAAYSSCIPTIVVGYSVKAIGIATDLFGSKDKYVIPVQEIFKEDTLLNAFKYIKEKENADRSHLNKTMCKYTKAAYNGVSELEKLI